MDSVFLLRQQLLELVLKRRATRPAFETSLRLLFGLGLFLSDVTCRACSPLRLLLALITEQVVWVFKLNVFDVIVVGHDSRGLVCAVDVLLPPDLGKEYVAVHQLLHVHASGNHEHQRLVEAVSE